MWRPERWSCPYWIPPSSEDSIGKEFRLRREGISRGECYEEGADAMFESLRPWLELAGLMLKDEGDANE